MEAKELSEEPQSQFQQNTESFDRRIENRRKNHSKGFTYISTVGWICRRENCRRESDPELWDSYGS